MPFKLDTLLDFPRYVGVDTYQTILDDKSRYDHLLLTVERRTFFGIQWGGWYFVYNTLPFGWKISPFVYHSTGLVVSIFFSDQWGYLVHCTSMTGTMANFRSRPTWGPMRTLQILNSFSQKPPAFGGQVCFIFIGGSGALLFTREMNNAISKALRTSRSIKLHGALREEISHWFFCARGMTHSPGEVNVISAYP